MSLARFAELRLPGPTALSVLSRSESVKKLFKYPEFNESPKVSDEVKKTTCYMCACRCGIDVHLRDGKVRYIQGNRDHPVNKGVLCAKGSAGIMQQYSPARLRAPLRRVGPRGSGEFKEISWDEALETAVSWLKPIRETDPKRLAFFSGRDQSQSFTGWFAQQFGTPNYAAHGGFCSVNMAAAGIYTLGGSFWEFGQPDWEMTRILMLFGVAEDHDSNPIKMGLARLKERGSKIIAVNPVRTGYNAIGGRMGRNHAGKPMGCSYSPWCMNCFVPGKLMRNTCFAIRTPRIW